MLQDFFEHTINKVYQNCRAVVFFFLSPLPNASSYIKFGGWEMSYNWKGRTRPTREKVGNTEIITKTVHFNYKYALHLMDVETVEEFTFPYFVRTIAHEIAHCLLLDYDPKYPYLEDQHNERHQMLTKQLEIYLWTLPKIKELTNLQPIPIIHK
ncbi:hypothetical protein [endosymbiont GvMRE of Glomus versiforme]|uniref:hypothetical protein n=1 Tax=endosymbiont GvMRE of Glomus versiforme TaxID=2039283 RepID=UPI000ECAD80F|nr:hypothetical protein [endosymbiont GvMRE of Glomus versiforme]RHZ36429.1 hypothetical protein GvMRE_Ic1g92 [endosymbiont GvMRE of Glomus versiforme]